ncbi:MAG: SpoIIE family protein phosphatase [Deltaproteobacteria bacterium]|nr:SpoIIE family protein phosphatase [Deltaproteobacteria bacterium]MBW2306930.1 SpoIIE family protein phosphatase [Deltaproteobacteria bacterium]
MKNSLNNDETLERMRILQEMSAILTSTYDLDRLMRRLFGKVAGVLGAAAGSLWLKEKESDELVCRVALPPNALLFEGRRLKLGQGIAGSVARSKKGMIIPDVEQEPRWDRSFDQKTGFRTRSILCVPLIVHGRSIGAIQFVNKLREEEQFSEADLAFSGSLANNCAAAIEHARLLEELQAKRQLEREMEIARSIQESMLPRRFPSIGGIEVAAATFPAHELGGDLYDVLQVGPQKYGFVIADVSGKSLPAALFMARACGLIRAESREGATPSNILCSVNEFLFDHSGTDMFVTVVYSIYNTQTESISYANAGHCAPLLIHQSGEHQPLETHGKPLGVVPELMLPQGKVELREGDLLILYTDGVVEAMNKEDEQFGETRFLELIKENRDEPLPEIIDRIRKAVIAFTGDSRQDDITLLVVRRKVGEENALLAG